jgi:hypothetical protein
MQDDMTFSLIVTKALKLSKLVNALNITTLNKIMFILVHVNSIENISASQLYEELSMV